VTAVAETTPRRTRSHVLWRYAPMIVFTGVYLVTCVLGCLLMIVDYRPFVLLFEYFTGTSVPPLTTGQTIVTLLLLFVAPACAWLGYWSAFHVRTRRLRQVTWVREHASSLSLDTPGWLPHMVFYTCAVLALSSITRAGAVKDLSSWLDYGAWVRARASTFRSMGFWEFVNIYVFVPVAAAWVVTETRRGGALAFVQRWLPLVVTLGLDVLLFQKKTAVASALLVYFAWLLYQRRPWSRTTQFLSATAVVAVVAIYFAAVVVPVYSQRASTVCDVRGVSCNSVFGKAPATLVYSMLSPVTRTSAPALYYPIIYPHEHSFYGPDVGQDILGIGSFPDDNLVVWRRLNPHSSTHGTTVVPFQFTFYSQAGLLGALLGSFLIGGLIGVAWRGVLSEVLPRAWSALCGSLILLFAVYVAIDSVRNSVIVSYGLAWGLGFVALAAAVVHLGNTKRVR
jgi:hypothetical protein